uniref:DUF6534 domain-containing protein n=1 Tax=Mycena chlorophos TaxID=658473 RepID=A0ABQ0KVQ1_MYCCL|nr:predicted protein [Mycena chlorophos]
MGLTFARFSGPDATHTLLVCITIWRYLVANFEDGNIVKHIEPTLAVSEHHAPHGQSTQAMKLSVAMTAIITLHFLHLESSPKSNFILFIVYMVLIIVALPLVSDSDVFLSKHESWLLATTTGMLLDKTFALFTSRFNKFIIAGLSVSAATDIIVSVARYYYLRNLNQGYPGTQEMVDAVLVFTLNDGGLTCAVVFAAIACVLKLPGTFVWIGIHFTIAKLYANSVLATLNLRNFYRYRHRPMGIPLNTRQGGQNLNIRAALSGNRATMTMSHDKLPGVVSTRANERNLSGMEVYIDQQVEYNVAVRVAADDCVDIGESEDSMKAPSMDRVRVTAV